MDLKGTITHMIAEQGNLKIRTNRGETNLKDFLATIDDRFDSLAVGLNRQGECVVKLADGRFSGPIFTVVGGSEAVGELEAAVN